jgi:histidyl-tRNA synthetase
MTDTYKGVRDFYPEDERVQGYLFSAMRRVVESYGYEEMNASILEPTELYVAKSSEEIVNEQTYTFTDRGDRSVTLRPEMTPTVARMVAAKKRELGFPLRWYSIQNFFRYERPQRGRLREFWQLNADLFGSSLPQADAEIFAVAYSIMRAFGATEKDFSIRLNHRGVFDLIATRHDVPEAVTKNIVRLFDKMAKMPRSEWEKELETLLPNNVPALQAFTELRNGIPDDVQQATGLNAVKEALTDAGLPSSVIKVDASLARGFDYYTGSIFEVFDEDQKNPRAVAGGGRYDKLIQSYGGEATSAVGFAMGDVVMRDFLETHGLMPTLHPATMLYLAPITLADVQGATALAQDLRSKGINVAVGILDKKVGDHIKAALKLNIPYFAAFGEKERSSDLITVKTLAKESEEVVTRGALSEFLSSQE